MSDLRRAAHSAPRRARDWRRRGRSWRRGWQPPWAPRRGWRARAGLQGKEEFKKRTIFLFFPTPPLPIPSLFLKFPSSSTSSLSSQLHAGRRSSSDFLANKSLGSSKRKKENKEKEAGSRLPSPLLLHSLSTSPSGRWIALVTEILTHAAEH